MKKIITLIMAIIMSLSLLGFAGCGGGSSDGGNDANTLVVTIEDTNSEIGVFTALKNAFIKKMKNEQNRDIVIKKSVYNNSQYQKDIGTLIATDDIGDVVYAYDNTSGILAKQGIFEDLNDYIAKDSSFDLSIYDEEILDSAKTYGSKLAYFPRSYDQMTLFINVDFFKTLDMEEDIPTKEKYGENWENWTWDEMLKICEKLRTRIDATDSPYYQTKNSVFPLAMDVFYNAVYDAVVKSFGGETVDGTNKTSGFQSSSDKYDQTVKAFDFLRSLVYDYKYTPASWGAFSSGQNAMSFAVRPSVNGCVDSQIDVAFAPVPKFTKNQTGRDNPTTYVNFGSSGYAIYSESKNKDLAWEFIKFCVGEEGQRIIGNTGICVPVIKSEQSQNGSWTTILEGVDQTAFVYNGHTRILATYARGVDPETEFNIYSKAQSTIIDKINKQGNTGKIIVDAIYSQIAQYIR